MGDRQNPPTPSGDITLLLSRWSNGDAQALEELLPRVYAELRQLAASYMRRERSGHTLQATGLVHEAYMRLVGAGEEQFQSRTHFFGAAAQAMRRILVDHARKHAADKRIGPGAKISLDDSPPLSTSQDYEVLALHEALDKLAEINERQAQVVELRYFGGLTESETAEFFGTSRSTVHRDWKLALMMLRRLIGETP